MTDIRWLRITSTDNIPPREGRPLLVGDRELAIFNLGDRFVAVDNRCPHSGGPLCDGIVSGSTVVCPLHAWKIDLESGCVERPSAGVGHSVNTYPTRVENGVVVIGVPADLAESGRTDDGRADVGRADIGKADLVRSALTGENGPTPSEGAAA